VPGFAARLRTGGALSGNSAAPDQRKGRQRMAQGKVLVTGGSGFLGINLLRLLHQKGYGLVSLDLVPFDYVDMLPHVTGIVGDIRKRADVDRAMAGVELVVHTAAALPLYSPEDIMSTDVQGTRVVLEGALAHGVKRAVHISSTAVYGVPDHHPLIETDKLDGVGPYGQAKIDAENVCLEFRQQGMIVPIIRPKTFIGPERLGVFDILFDWALDKRNFPMIGSGRNRYQFLDVADLCDSILLAMTLPAEKVNDTFNVGAREFRTMREDYQAVLDEAGFGRKVVGLPEGPVILALKILEAMKLSPLYKWVYDTAGKDSFVSIEKAERILGYNPRFSNQDALLRNFRWYRDNRQSFAHSSGVSHRVPWKQGALGLLKNFF
jgi:nucleoside-diphosphate-sugar epimerase